MCWLWEDGELTSNGDDEKREPLAGSADDRAVTLAAASADESTLTAQGKPGSPSVEEALRAAGGEAGRYVEQGIIGRGGMGEVALCIERKTPRVGQSAARAEAGLNWREWG